MSQKLLTRLKGNLRNRTWRLFIALFIVFSLIPLFSTNTYARFGNSSENNSSNEEASAEEDKTSENKDETKEEQSQEYENTDSQQFIVYFIDVGQGDSSLIQCGDHAMLIDGGRSKQSDKIYSFLKQNGISHLDYIVATHPDDDHIGGLAGALNYATVDVAFSPVNNNNSESFHNFQKYLTKQDIEITVPKAGEQYSLGKSTITILGPTEIVDTDNNNSIVLKVEYGDYCFLFAGDAEKEEENKIIRSNRDLKSDVLKVGHHGSASSTSEEWLSAVGPSAAILSCGSDNEFGHPTEEVLERLKGHNIQVFRTDLQGDILFFEDKGELYYTVEKNPDADVFVPGDKVDEILLPLVMQDPDGDASSDETDVTRGEIGENDKNEMTYILNINTGVFHYIDCRGVRQMKDSNKKYVTCDRQELLDQGYRSCGICHP